MTQKMKPNILGWSCTMIAAVLVLTGCLKSPDNITQPPATAYVSIMHLAPTAPSLDVFFNDTKVSNAAFAPGTVTTGYNAVEKGAFAVIFKKAGSDSIVASISPAQYDSLNYYTLLIYNQQAGGAASATRIRDDFSTLTNDKSYYRFFHASPNTGAVDLYIDNIKIQNNRMLADNTGYDALNKFSATTSGSHDIQVKLAGTETVIATLTYTDLQPGNAYTFYLKGLEGGTGANQLSIGLLRAN